MTEAAEHAEPEAMLAGEHPARAAKRPAPNRPVGPDWVDWCDADR